MSNNIEQLVNYDITEAAISEMANRFLPLKVESHEDQDNYKSCKEAYKFVRSKHLEIEARRKELKQDSLTFGRVVDAKAKNIFDMLEPIENHLKEQVKIVDDYKVRQREEVARIAAERMKARTDKLTTLSIMFTPEIAALNDEQFDRFFAERKADYDKQKAEQAAKDAELEELRKLKADQDAKLAAEKERLILEQQAEIRKQNEARLAAEQELVKQQQEKAKLEALEAQAKALEAKAKAEREAKAASEIANKKAFEAIKKKFPTIEECWIEIHRLTNKV